jgi:hypothetical protein
LYEIEMLAGEQIRFTTQHLFDEPAGVREPNDLDAALIVYDQMAITLARDEDSLDGKNARIDFVAPADGTYVVQLVAESGAGEYMLQVSHGPFVDDTLQVTSLTPNASGFDVQFNRQLDPSSLNLYDADNQFGPADFTLTGATVGSVAGSLVIDSGLRKVAFIKTGGILEPDTYSVALRSGADAFQDWQGEPLDGDGDGTGTQGDDYAGSFVVATPGGITVGLPDFTRGPDQAANLPPSELDAGIPLALSQGFRVDRVEFELHYDPTLLNVSGFTLDSEVVGRGGQAVFTPLLPGSVGLTITAPTGLSGAQGPIIAGAFTAGVPADAAYGASHILDVANLTVRLAAIGDIPAIDDDALHVAAYLGDATGNKDYSGLDAQRVARVGVGLDTGFDAFPRIDPVVIADVTVNGDLSGLDAQRIAQEAVGLDPDEIPSLPQSLRLESPAKGPTRQALANSTSASRGVGTSGRQNTASTTAPSTTAPRHGRFVETTPREASEFANQPASHDWLPSRGTPTHVSWETLKTIMRDFDPVLTYGQETEVIPNDEFPLGIRPWPEESLGDLVDELSEIEDLGQGNPLDADLVDQLFGTRWSWERDRTEDR